MISRRTRKKREARESGSNTELNLTPMMDIFTIILVFLLKAFSAQGQLVTPAEGLTLPTSSIEGVAAEALSIKVLHDKIILEDNIILDNSQFRTMFKSKADKLIKPLYVALSKHAEEAKKSAEMFGGAFSGQVTIQGDSSLPYSILKRIMYTSAEAGYPVMKLLVYREE